MPGPPEETQFKGHPEEPYLGGSWDRWGPGGEEMPRACHAAGMLLSRRLVMCLQGLLHHWLPQQPQRRRPEGRVRQADGKGLQPGMERSKEVLQLNVTGRDVLNRNGCQNVEVMKGILQDFETNSIGGGEKTKQKTSSIK